MDKEVEGENKPDVISSDIDSSDGGSGGGDHIGGKVEKLVAENKRLVHLLVKERVHRAEAEKQARIQERLVAQHHKEEEARLKVIRDLQIELTALDPEHEHLVESNRMFAQAADAAGVEMEKMRLRLAQGLAGTDEEVSEAVRTVADTSKRAREMAADLLVKTNSYKNNIIRHEKAYQAMENAVRPLRQLAELQTLDGVLLHPILKALEDAIEIKPVNLQFEEPKIYSKTQA